MLRSSATLLSLTLAPALALIPAATLRAGGEIIMPPISAPLSGCGEIVYDEICETLLRLDDGSHYIFSGIDEYEIGDRLFIAGDVCLICLLTECGSGYSALFNTTVLECESTGKGEPVEFFGCVEVVVDAACGPVLLTESGELIYGEPFVSSEQEGLRFSATGSLSSQFTVLCPGGGPVPTSLPFFVELTLSGCTGDLNADGMVNGADLAGLLASWGPSCESTGACFADLNGDGAVDGADLAALLAAWG